MHDGTHHGQKKTGPTLLELVLRMHGDFRRSLEPIRVTPLQAGALLFLRRHAEARMTDAATALGVRLPTMSTVVKDLVRKRWVTRQLGQGRPCRSITAQSAGDRARPPNRAAGLPSGGHEDRVRLLLTYAHRCTRTTAEALCRTY